MPCDNINRNEITSNFIFNIKKINKKVLILFDIGKQFMGISGPNLNGKSVI